MSETNIAIKTLNGHPLADTEARAEIETLKKNAETSGGNAGGGGAGVTIVKVSASTEDMQTFTVTSCDKTYTELKAAYDADGLLWCRLNLNIMGNEALCECPLEAIDMVNNYMLFCPFNQLREMGVLVQINADGTCEVGIL